MLLLVSVFTGIGIGASILIAQFFGSGQKEKLQSTVDTLYIAMVVGAAVITVSGIVCARPFLNLMNTPQGDTMEMSALYLKTMFAGTFVSFGYNINNAILQGVGDSKSSLLFLSIATVINIVLDLIFVTVFDMGIFGVALATLIACVVHKPHDYAIPHIAASYKIRYEYFIALYPYRIAGRSSKRAVFHRDGCIAAFGKRARKRFYGRVQRNK